MSAGGGLAGPLLDALPQTQCRRCGYADCRAYAEAMGAREADVNRCPPGGDEGVARLAAIAGRPVRPVDPACGSVGPRRIAVIDEGVCIGCAICLDACPVDAILGASRHLHTVLAAQCTGCELCVPACPVDCIAMTPRPDADAALTGWAAWSAGQAADARRRHAAHVARLG